MDLINIFIIFMTILLPIGIYRAYSDFRKEKTFQINLFGKTQKHEGEKAKKYLFISFVLQCLVVIVLWIFFWQ